MIRGVRAFFLGALFVVLFTAISFAGNATDDSFSITPKASFLMISLPEYAPIIIYDAGVSTKRGTDTTEDGDMAALKYGLTLDWETPHTYNKYPVIFKASTYYSNMSNEQSQAIYQRSASLAPAWVRVDGSGYRNFSWPSGQYITATTKREVEIFGAELLLGLDEIPLGNDVTITPFFGYSTMYVDQNFTTFSRNYDYAPNALMNMQLDESVSGFYNGVLGGARVKRAKGNFEWHGSANVAAQYVIARYKGAQIIRQVGVSSNEYTHSDTTTKCSFQGKLETGATYRISDWKFGASAGFEFNSAMPEIKTGGKDKPTSIGWKESLAGEVGLNLAYEF